MFNALLILNVVVVKDVHLTVAYHAVLGLMGAIAKRIIPYLNLIVKKSICHLAELKTERLMCPV